MADPREKRVELILQQLEELPTLPAVAVRVLEATARENSSADEVAQIIQSDPAFASRILQLIHRADSGVRGEVTDVAKVMLARQEAGIAFEATLQVRNRLLSAYQDIMRMGV